MRMTWTPCCSADLPRRACPAVEWTCFLAPSGCIAAEHIALTDPE